MLLPMLVIETRDDMVFANDKYVGEMSFDGEFYTTVTASEAYQNEEDIDDYRAALFQLLVDEGAIVEKPQ